MARVGQEAAEYNGFSRTHTYFESGNKRLTLTIHVTIGEANTRIDTIQGKPRVSGATTQVYTEARDLIQATANELGRPIRYVFSTVFIDSIRLWAIDPERGAGVFNWDKVDPNDFSRGIFTAVKTFYPVA